MRGQAGKGGLAFSVPGCQTLVTGVRLRRSASNLAIVSTTILDTPPGLGLQDNSEDSLERDQASGATVAQPPGRGEAELGEDHGKGLLKGSRTSAIFEFRSSRPAPTTGKNKGARTLFSVHFPLSCRPAPWPQRAHQTEALRHPFRPTLGGRTAARAPGTVPEGAPVKPKRVLTPLFSHPIYERRFPQGGND